LYLIFSPAQTVLVNYGYPDYHVYGIFSASRVGWFNFDPIGYNVMLFVYIIKNVVTFAVETVLFNSI
jgi:hypothetical protein